MDLLGYVWQENRDKEHSHPEGALKTQGRDAPALLLGRLYPSLNEVKYHHAQKDIIIIAVMEKSESQPEEIRIIDGKRYRKVFSGYTVRQYYSHETSEKGPGPGWDYFAGAPDEIAKKYGINKPITQISPNDLPDEPLYLWQEVEEKK